LSGHRLQLTFTFRVGAQSLVGESRSPRQSWKTADQQAQNQGQITQLGLHCCFLVGQPHFALFSGRSGRVKSTYFAAATNFLCIKMGSLSAELAFHSCDRTGCAKECCVASEKYRNRKGAFRVCFNYSTDMIYYQILLLYLMAFEIYMF